MKRPTTGTSYFYLVIVAGAILALWVLTQFHATPPVAGPLFWGLSVLCILTELIAVPLPKGGRLTASFAFLFASLLLQGLLPTMATVAVTALVANGIVQRRHWSLAAFNFAQYSLSYGAAQAVLTVGGLGHEPYLGVSEHLPLLGLAMLTQLSVNIVLVNGYIALEKRIPLWRVLWEDDRWELLFTVILSPLSVAMVGLYHTRGPKGAAVILLPLVVLAVVLILYLQVRQSRSELASANQELSLLHQIAQRVGSQIDFSKTMQLIASETRSVVPDAEVMVFLVDEERQVLVRQRTLESEPRRGLEVPVGVGLIARAAASPRAVRLDQLHGLLSEDEEYLAGFQSALIVPIVSDISNLGAIALFSKVPRGFDARSERILTVLATQSAIAIKNAQLYLQTQQLAITDGLTGVYNRRYFQRQLEAEFRRAPRFGYPVGLILLDVDFFKQFNDSHGHLLGDQVLRSLAQILKDSVRDSDVVARYGGEEFVVILPETHAEGALDVAERIRRNIAAFTFWGRGETPVSVTASIGVVSRMASELKPDELIDLADAALYQAKRTGRDRICAANAEGTQPFVMAPQRVVAEPNAKRRAPARQKLNLDDTAWQTYMLESVEPVVALLGDRLAAHDLNLSANERARWHATISAVLAGLASQLAEPAGVGRVTHDALATNPLYPEIKAGITNLIQQGITLTQSESLVLALCNSLAQHVQQGPFSPAERLHVLSEVERFTHTLQLAISQVWHEFYQQTNNQLVILNNLEARITNAYELDELLAEGTQLACEALRADACMLFMPGRSGDMMRVRAHAGVEDPEVIAWQIPRSASLTGSAFQTLKPTVYPDLDELEPSAAVPEFPRFRAATGTRSAVFFPLAHRGDPLGVLVCFSRLTHHFDPGGIRLGRGIAGQLAAAIARMQAQDQRQDTYLQAIASMVEALEAKDDFTRGHSEALVRYAVAIGRQMKLDEPELEILRQAATLHDLGKLALPEAVLNKPGPLTPAERELVETHPDVGARLLSTVSSLGAVVPVVRHHHELWNGTGYPDRLAGEDIPLLARILAAAEAFDGMTTAKSYREAIPRDAALDEMKGSAHFDPVVLGALDSALAIMELA